MRFQHSQLAIASEPLLFLFLAWHNWKLVSTNVQVQLRINVSSAVAKTLSKTGITNLTKLNQKKMMEKYGSKGHIIETNNIVFFIACGNYHLFRLTTTSKRGFIKANKGTSSTHQTPAEKNGTPSWWICQGAELRKHPLRRVLTTTSFRSSGKNHTKSHGLPGFTGFTWSSTCVHLKGTVVPPRPGKKTCSKTSKCRRQGSSEPMLRTSETWLRAGTKSSMKTWDKDIMCRDYPRK